MSNAERRREAFHEKPRLRARLFLFFPCASVTTSVASQPRNRNKNQPVSIHALKRHRRCATNPVFPDRRATPPLSRRGRARTRIHHVHPPHFCQGGAGEGVRRVRARERCAPGPRPDAGDVLQSHRLPRAPDIPYARVCVPRAVRDKDARADVPHLRVEGVRPHERVPAQVLQPQGVQVRARHAVRAVHRGMPRVSGEEKAPHVAGDLREPRVFHARRATHRRGIETPWRTRRGYRTPRARGASEPHLRRARPPASSTSCSTRLRQNR